MNYKMYILELLSHNYYLIKNLGYELEFPIILLSDERGQNIYRALGLHDETISERFSDKRYEQMVTSETPGFLLYQFFDCPSCRDFVEKIVRDVYSGMVETGSINKIPLVLMKSIPLDFDTEKAFLIDLDDVNTSVTINHFQGVSDDAVGLVIDRIGSLLNDSMSPIEKVLKAACCFAYPSLKDDDLKRNFEILLQTVDEMICFDQANKNLGEIGEIFRACLYDWGDQTDFGEVYELPNLEMCVINNIDQAICFDDEYLYLKDSLFTEIKNTHLAKFGIEAIKRSLVEEGIIVADNCAINTYTSKMKYRNIAGQFKDIRMLKFKLEEINQAGNIDFIQLCKSRKRGKKDD